MAIFHQSSILKSDVIYCFALSYRCTSEVEISVPQFPNRIFQNFHENGVLGLLQCDKHSGQVGNCLSVLIWEQDFLRSSRKSTNQVTFRIYSHYCPGQLMSLTSKHAYSHFQISNFLECPRKCLDQSRYPVQKSS